MADAQPSMYKKRNDLIVRTLSLLQREVAAIEAAGPGVCASDRCVTAAVALSTIFRDLNGCA